MKKTLLAFIVLLWLAINANAQCNVISGDSGIIQNAAQTISVHYDLSIAGGTVMANLGSYSSCGYTFPSIVAPWTNNTNAMGTATYTFSVPLTSVDVFVAYVGVTGTFGPETFTFTTNGSVPALSINTGSCPGWTTTANTTTSPQIAGAWNVLTTVTSATPFTTLTIESGLNTSQNGGSSYGLCSSSAVPANSCNLASPTITADQTIFCASDSALICAPTGFTSYQWNIGGTANCVTAHNAGNYYVTVTDNNGCTAESNHIAISVHPLPPVSISVNGDTLRVYNAVSYQWYFNNGLINGATDSVFIATQTGNYAVMITDTNGCHATSNNAFVVVSAIAEVNEEILSLSPNPATSQLNITSSVPIEQINIYNTTGQLVRAIDVRAIHESPQLQLDVSQLTNGLYIAELKTKDTTVMRRWVKM